MRVLGFPGGKGNGIGSRGFEDGTMQSIEGNCVCIELAVLRIVAFGVLTMHTTQIMHRGGNEKMQS